MLNRHGYGFHYRVIREVDRCSSGGSSWRFSCSEFPVEVKGRSTRIDFVLESGVKSNRFRSYLVCECKRVNPAFGRWCFIRSPYTRHNQPLDKLVVETASRRPHGLISEALENIDIFGSAYHMALPIKVRVTGDSQPKSHSDEVEEAVTQAIRGMNGFVNMLGSQSQLIGANTVFLLPVVFTTAELWVSHADLAAAELNSGNIDITTAGFETVNWLWYQYNTSPGLKHDYSSLGAPDLETLMGSEFTRSVAIVNHRGIERFLEWSSNHLG